MQQDMLGDDSEEVFGMDELTLSEQKCRNQKTFHNQQCSPLLKLPAELRSKIFKLAFYDDTVYIEDESFASIPKSACWEPEKRRRNPPFAIRRQPDYRGAFALSYTCRQIHHEASPALVANNLLFDSTGALYADMTAPMLGRSIPHVRAIRINEEEAWRMIPWFVRGAVNSNGDGHHYAKDLFPSLASVETAARQRPLYYSLATMQKAIEFCFNKESLDVLVKWSEESKLKE